MSSSTENGNGIPLWREILKLSTLINKANSEHFDVLTIFFLLPFLFTPTVYPSFHLALFHPDYHFNNKLIQFEISLSNFEIIALIICTLYFTLFFLCAVATFTYSAVQASYRRPINLVSSIKSIRYSFFRLLSTFIISHTILISITLIFALVLALLSQILELKYDLNHLIIFALIVLVPILVWLQVNWSLAYVVAVVESKQGYETLRRSAYLVKGVGVRSIVLSMVLFYGLVVGGMVVGGSMLFFIMCTSDQWIISAVILPILVISVVISYKTMNQYLVGNAVLYMYCNDFNGEKFPLEIGDNECSDEYQSLNTV
ncbi:uncharacterized protein LOC125869031 [Solanum stenotomum]|uniref:uncharacterized protein LOC125869031 n=1 Tax=Solanum stenotomum TaxID=172797 RepID=UPI0020D0BEA0|nr:uncharacterized protein LOC125869031 [Solanum stenotomum]